MFEESQNLCEYPSIHSNLPCEMRQTFHVKHITANVNRLSMIRNELSCLKI